jgi:hypothetical protein
MVMISSWGMRGKGIGFRSSARGACGACGPREPLDRWRPRRPCSSRPLDRVRKGHRFGHRRHRGDLARCSRVLRRGPCCPFGPGDALRPTERGRKPIPPLGTLGPPPTCRPTCAAVGPRGRETSCHGQPLIGAGAAGPEIPFGPAFRLKFSIDKLRWQSPCSCVRCKQLKPPCSRARNELPPVHSITSSARASLATWRPLMTN